MWAMVTGASSGIGKEMALYLAEIGYDLLLVGRNKDKLDEVAKLVSTKSLVIDMDLSISKNVFKLIDIVSDKDISVVINNAGIGVYGDYLVNDINDEVRMINLDVMCLHILTNYFIKNKNVKYIMNVSSTAGLVKAGPLMSGYYACKNYVSSYTMGIYKELKMNKSNTRICLLCPGPVDTNFNKNANINNSLKSMDVRYVSRYGIDMMFRNKFIIIPGFKNKIGVIFGNLLPRFLFLDVMYNIQLKKKR